MANEITTTSQKLTATLASKATEWITTSISEGKITVPQGYDIGSEMFSAMMRISQIKDRNGKRALDVCTEASVLSSLRDMAVQGLSMARNQCYMIVYGNELVLQRSYFGSVSVFNRFFPQYKVSADVIYEGDEYILEHNDMHDFDDIHITSRKLENRDNAIVAAYGIIIDKQTGERIDGCIMTMKEIRTSWSHAKTQNVQNEFPQEMAKRTILNRMLKPWINSAISPSNTSMFDAYTRTTKNEFAEDELVDVTPSDTDKMLASKSQGKEGLERLLNARKATVAKASQPAKAPVEETPRQKEEETIDKNNSPKSEYKKVASLPNEEFDEETGEVKQGTFEGMDIPL